MKRAILTATATALLTLSWALPAQGAEAGECEPPEPSFGFCHLDIQFTNEDGSPATQAGSHPFAVTTTIDANTETVAGGKIPAGQPRDLIVTLPPGLTGSPDATPKCTAEEFSTLLAFLGGALNLPACPDSSAVGVARARGSSGGTKVAELPTPVYNLEPPPGVALRLGFAVTLVGQVVVDFDINEAPPYNVIVASRNITQVERFYGIDVELWSDPGNPAHDDDRGLCGAAIEGGEKEGGDAGDILGITCPTSIPARPFITLPRACTGPLTVAFESISWQGDTARESILTHNPFGEAAGMGGCERLGLEAEISSEPTSHSASSPAGLDFGLDLRNEGLTKVDGISNSDIKKAVVTLPEGVTINPSQAEGLAVCSEAQFERERSDSAFGAGCPAASKIGSVEVETPLLEGVLLKGSVFVATPDDSATAAPENPFNSLIALYMTIKEPERGINIGIAGKVEPDPRTGQIRATFDDLPQQPFSHFRFHFREGGRSPLITPPQCGSYETEAIFTPWANPSNPLTTTASFEVDHGPSGGPCPPPGTPPFEPGFSAGAISNQAGAYSPFHMRLTRRDGDQDLTRLAAKLPLGMVAKLAGVDRCSETQIAIAKSKSGRAELVSPSCPANSQIGTATGGAGVGSQLTYVPGKIYLAGPYNGAPLSVVGIVPAVAGPFDVGTIVTRFALQIDPRTAQVTVDGERSDPIPHILAGIPLAVRDIRADVDRPNFTINPTSCEPTEVGARIWGGGADVFSSLDDSPVNRSARFQIAGCRGLGFKPSLSLRLKGGTERGDHPALHAVFRPRSGDANTEGLVLRLPHSAFLDQAHIRTICTRVQFAANNCPPGAIYGRVRAYTPLLDEVVEGPIYLRSSDHNLPDMVFDLHSLVDFEAVARIDSRHGGIRATFTQIPDAQLSKVVVDMQGARKGLIINSTDICTGKHRANVLLSAHNGKQLKVNPVLGASCGRGGHSRRR